MMNFSFTHISFTCCNHEAGTAADNLAYSL